MKSSPPQQGVLYIGQVITSLLYIGQVITSLLYIGKVITSVGQLAELTYKYLPAFSTRGKVLTFSFSDKRLRTCS